MVYNRGNRHHFDEWANKYNCSGWNYDNLLQYFLRSENQIDVKYLRENRGLHNTSGPITVSSDWNHLDVLPIFSDFLQTANMSGYPTIDINGM